MLLILTSTTEFLKHKLQLPKFVKIVCSERKEKSRKFPDGEIYTKLNITKTEHVVVLHSGQPRSNDGLVELEMILGILKQHRVRRIEVFFIYFPYGMQDVERLGELNMAEAIVQKFVQYYGVKKIFALDPHFAGRSWVKRYPVKIISALPLLKAEVRRQYPEAIFVAADQGSNKRTGLLGLTKKRIGVKQVIINMSPALRRLIQDRTVAIVDDLIETGATIVAAGLACRRAGARRIVVVVAHGVLPAGLSRVKKMFKQVFVTNSIQHIQKYVDITALIKAEL